MEGHVDVINTICAVFIQSPSSGSDGIQLPLACPRASQRLHLAVDTGFWQLFGELMGRRMQMLGKDCWRAVGMILGVKNSPQLGAYLGQHGVMSLPIHQGAWGGGGS
jgi:hypothetical protein